MPFIDALAAHLAAEGLGTVGESIFLWFAPATPGVSITLSPSPGGQPDAKFAYDEVRLQVRVRGTDSGEVAAKLEAVYEALQSLSGVSVGDYYLVDCQALQSTPAYLGRDASGRDDFTQNFTARVKRPTAGHRL